MDTSVKYKDYKIVIDSCNFMLFKLKKLLGHYSTMSSALKAIVLDMCHDGTTIELGEYMAKYEALWEDMKKTCMETSVMSLGNDDICPHCKEKVTGGHIYLQSINKKFHDYCYQPWLELESI